MCSMRTPHESAHIFFSTSMTRSGKGDKLGSDLAKWVVSVRLLWISGVQIDYVSPSRGSYPCRDLLSQISVRVDERKATAAHQVLGGHTL
jgi:hypothetical protein